MQNFEFTFCGRAKNCSQGPATGWTLRWMQRDWSNPKLWIVLGCVHRCFQDRRVSLSCRTTVTPSGGFVTFFTAELKKTHSYPWQSEMCGFEIHRIVLKRANYTEPKGMETKTTRNGLESNFWLLAHSRTKLTRSGLQMSIRLHIWWYKIWRIL
jgi:hypothetical protein